MPETYEMNINVNGAKSGSDRLAATQGEVLPTPEQAQLPPQREIEVVEQYTGLSINPDVVLASTVVLGNEALRAYEQEQKFKGDSNRITKINEVKKNVGRGLVIAGGFAKGGVLGGLSAIAWTAYNLSQENRELINEQKIDSYQSSYYQERLINDVAGRSR